MAMEENEKAGSDDAIRKRNPIQVRKNMCMLDHKVDPLQGPPWRSFPATREDDGRRKEFERPSEMGDGRVWTRVTSVMGVCGLVRQDPARAFG